MSLKIYLERLRARRTQYLLHRCVLELGFFVDGWRLIDPSVDQVADALRSPSGALSEASYWQRLLFEEDDTEAAFERGVDELLELELSGSVSSCEELDLIPFVLDAIERNRLAAYIGSTSFCRLYAFLRGALAAQELFDPGRARETVVALERFGHFMGQVYEVKTSWWLLIYGLHGDAHGVAAFATEWRRCSGGSA